MKALAADTNHESNQGVMATLTIRNIEDDIKAMLRSNAARHGWSMAWDSPCCLMATAKWHLLKIKVRPPEDKKEGSDIMNTEYTAVVKQDGAWWIGWIEEVPGVNCQEHTYQELINTLRTTLKEALELNRQDAILAVGDGYIEEKIALTL